MDKTELFYYLKLCQVIHENDQINQSVRNDKGSENVDFIEQRIDVINNNIEGVVDVDQLMPEIQKSESINKEDQRQNCISDSENNNNNFCYPSISETNNTRKTAAGTDHNIVDDEDDDNCIPLAITNKNFEGHQAPLEVKKLTADKNDEIKIEQSNSIHVVEVYTQPDHQQKSTVQTKFSRNVVQRQPSRQPISDDMLNLIESLNDEEDDDDANNDKDDDKKKTISVEKQPAKSDTSDDKKKYTQLQASILKESFYKAKKRPPTKTLKTSVPKKAKLQDDDEEEIDEDNIDKKKQQWTSLTCHKCGKQCQTNHSLQKHICQNIDQKVLQQNIRHPCTICDKVFVYKCRLKEHLRIHYIEKQYLCDFCRKSFTKKDALTVHLRVHTGERPFQCNQCLKRFIQSAHLKKHQKTHEATTTTRTSSSSSN